MVDQIQCDLVMLRSKSFQEADKADTNSSKQYHVGFAYGIDAALQMLADGKRKPAERVETTPINDAAVAATVTYFRNLSSENAAYRVNPYHDGCHEAYKHAAEIVGMLRGPAKEER